MQEFCSFFLSEKKGFFGEIHGSVHVRVAECFIKMVSLIYIELPPSNMLVTCMPQLQVIRKQSKAKIKLFQ